MLLDIKPTVMQATPATWRLSPEAGRAGGAQLTALCGGEALPPELAQPLLARAAAVWNLYGPTETTVTRYDQESSLRSKYASESAASERRH